MNYLNFYIPIRYRLLFWLLLFTTLCAQAQDITISGTVSARGGGGTLPGVSVTNLVTKQTVSTDVNGRYSIKAKSGAILSFSYIGFVTQQQTVKGATHNVLLDAKANDLNEIVVVGYGTTSRKNLSTSVAKIDPKDVPQAANSSVAQLVFGRAAGVQAVQRSAEPGGNINISIRGRGAPLIVIDGVVMPYDGLEPGNSGVANELNGVRRGGFAGLNPDDIESMEFLKDASAGIYGVNAANGVVLITTKKGKSGRTSVNYDGSRSYVASQKYLEPLAAHAYMEQFNRLANDKYLFDNKMAPYGTVAPGTLAPKYTQAEIQNAGEGTDWLDLVLRNGSVDNHNLSISGGSEKLTYYVSGGYFGQDGTIEKSGMSRYTGRMNLNFKFTDWLGLNAIVSGGKTNFLNSTAGWQSGNAGSQAFGSLQAAVAYPRSIPVYDADGNYSLFQVTGNPVSLLDIKDNTSLNNLNTTLSAEIKILGNELKGKLLYGNNFESSNRDFFVPSTTFYFQLFRPRGSRNQAERQLQTMEATLSYQKNFLNDKLKVDLMGGIGQYTNDYLTFGAASADMKDGINTDRLASGTGAISVNSNRYADKKRSYFGRANFDVLDRYVLQLTGRYDGFSQFFPENKYAFFPTASVAWKLSNESFLKGVSFLSLLKIRASIGTTGEASGFAYASFIPDNSLISFNSGGTQLYPYALSQFDRPDLQWPKTVNKNVGLDFAVLDNRISGSIDIFQDDMTRIISNDAPTAPLSFFGTQPVNGAHRVRKGWEGSVTTSNISSKNFKWNSTLNLTHVEYEHKERFPFEVLAQGAEITDPVNSIYVFKTNGIIQPGETLTGAQKTLPARGQLPGNPRIIDVNGDAKLDASDIVRFDSSPDLTIGFGNTFSYKNFDLNIFFYGSKGAYGFNNLRAWANPQSILSGAQSGIAELTNVWSASNPNGTIPGVAFDQAALGLPAGLDVDLQKTDFIRCRNIALGYTLNQSFISKYVRNLRLFLDLQNPFIITNYKIADPEVQAEARKGGPAPYPMATTYSIGFKAGF